MTDPQDDNNENDTYDDTKPGLDEGSEPDADEGPDEDYAPIN